MNYRFNNPTLDDIPELSAPDPRTPASWEGFGLRAIYYSIVFALMVIPAGFAVYYRLASARSTDQLRSLKSEHATLIDQHFDVLKTRYERTAIDPRLQSQYLLDTRAFLKSYSTSRDTKKIDAAEECTSMTDSSPVALSLLNSTSGTNYRHIDLSVVDAQTSQFLEGLSRIDFELSIGGERLSSVVVQKHSLSGEKRAVAILQDKSGSMKGVADTKACAAVESYVNATNKNTWHKIWTFTDRAHPKTPWTTDKTVLRTACLPDEPNGATVLYGSLREVLADLATRSERRHLIAITDGVESSGASNVQGIVDLAKRSQTKIFSVGLKSDNLNEDVLKQLSAGTGGSYFRADNPEELQRCLNEVATTTERPSYRLIALLPIPSDLPIEIRIGNATLSVPLESAK
ncbi:MAG: vWA domain-containing protein [Pirellula sp.]